MDEYGCGSSGVWEIHSDISLDGVVISVYYWGYIQLGLFSMACYCSSGVDWSLDQI